MSAASRPAAPAGGPDDNTAQLPCRYCVANWKGMTARTGGGIEILPTVDDCQSAHRDDPRVYALAEAFAKAIQGQPPTDEQAAWFLEDADEVVDDFDPPPARWSVRKLPNAKSDEENEIECRFRINGVTYVALEGGKDTRGSLMPLSTFREHLREANRSYAT